MRKILDGVREFQQKAFIEQRQFFEHLAQKQQTPVALFIVMVEPAAEHTPDTLIVTGSPEKV